MVSGVWTPGIPQNGVKGIFKNRGCKSMTDISLTAASRENLLALQRTQSFISRTQGRLATGEAVATVIDDALKYFQAKALADRARDLSARKDSIDQGINNLKVVVEATEQAERLINQMRGILDTTRTSTPDQRKEFGLQIRNLAYQVQKLITDASYQGQNLLSSSASRLSVFFSEKADSVLQIDGVNFNASELFRTTDNQALGVQVSGITMDPSLILNQLGFTQLLSDYQLSLASVQASYNGVTNLVLQRLERTIDNIRAKASAFGGSVAILQVRLDFTKNYTNILTEGSDKLTLADINEEGANLLALQTRQQLSIQALSFAGQSEQAVLNLFR